jgi:fumarate reductase subunit C
MAEEMMRKPYVREVPRMAWVLRHPRYMRYMARELSCLFIGAYTLLLVVGLKRLSEGPAAYEAFLQALASPLGVVFHIVALAFAAYHSITWFKLTPKAMPLLIGERFVPDAVIAGAHYAAWIVVSLAVLALAGVL